MPQLSIKSGRQVTLHFALKLDDGQVIDSNFQGNPATFVVGDGNLPEGFERALIGLAAGDEGVYRIPPARAFGMPNPDNIQAFPKTHFKPDMILEEGVVISFSDAARTDLFGVVKRVADDWVSVDFNHPLAGKDLMFEVRVISVTDAVTTNCNSEESGHWTST